MSYQSLKSSSEELCGTSAENIDDALPTPGIIPPHYPQYNPTHCDFCQTCNQCNLSNDVNWSEIDTNLGWQYCYCCSPRYLCTKLHFETNAGELEAFLGPNFIIKPKLTDESKCTPVHNTSWTILRCLRPTLNCPYVVHLQSTDTFLVHECKKSPLPQNLVKITTKILLNDLLILNGKTE